LLYGDPDVVEVRRTFETRKRAVFWEECVIRRMKMISDDRWLNKANAGKSFFVPEKLPEEWKNKIKMNSSGLSGEKNPMFGKKGNLNPNYNNKWSSEKKMLFAKARAGEKNPNYGIYWSENQKTEASRRVSNEKNPMFGKKGNLNPNFGNKTKWICPVCKKEGGISAMKGHHGMFGEKCKYKMEKTNEE
jgi:hypothetical protein